MEKLEKLGFETIGTQSGKPKYMYRNKETGQVVVYHSLLLHPDGKEIGVPLMTMREVSLQKMMKHDNIARLVNIDYDSGYGFVRLIFEYPGMNLTNFINKHPNKASDPIIIKKLLRQLLSGLSYYHSIKAAHGNLNAKNVLIDPNTDKLKILNLPLDLNLECYLAPELLLGSKVLTPASDMFAVGCLFGEMLTKATLFRGSTNDARRKSIFNLLGTPTEQNWPEAMRQSVLSEQEKIEPKELKELFPRLEEEGLDLISKLLCLNPLKRITVADSLKHPYFKEA